MSIHVHKCTPASPLLPPSVHSNRLDTTLLLYHFRPTFKLTPPVVPLSPHLSTDPFFGTPFVSPHSLASILSHPVRLTPSTSDCHYPGPCHARLSTKASSASFSLTNRKPPGRSAEMVLRRKCTESSEARRRGEGAGSEETERRMRKMRPRVVSTYGGGGVNLCR